MMPDTWGPPSAAEISAAENENARLSKRVKELEAKNAELLEEVERLSKTAFEQNTVILEDHDIMITQERARANLQDKIWQLEQKVPRWISVEERLPGDDCDWVLAIGKFVPENIYGKPIISELRKDGKWWGDINDEFPLEDMGIRITHWMPIPQPPKEE